MTDGPLARIDQARRLLAEARTVDDLKIVRDKAETARILARKIGLSLESQNHAAQIKIDAERALGELLEETVEHEGGRPPKNGDTMSPFPGPPTLDDLGLSKKQSSRWQAIARVPEDQYRGYVEKQNGAGEEITSADLLRMAPPRPSTNGHGEDDVPGPVVTLTQWHAMTPLERERVVAEAPRSSRAGMIKHAETDADRAIAWAIWSRNVVTGCEHDCPYCYARDIANRLFPYGFEPALHPDRLHSPRNTRVPAAAAEPGGVGHRNIFSDSMADLFGKWVPQEWIDAELAVARECPQWNFLYLTKFPQRLAEQEWAANTWVGTSVDRQARVRTAERAFAGVRAGVKWLSCEPMLERLTFSSLSMFDWVVIGGATSSSQTPAFRPPAEWVEHLVGQARAAGCRVYLKSNLRYVKEYPGGEE